MAKVRGPLLSLTARGQIGRSQVYASWRGVAYARQHVTPANPRTTAQTLTRNTFSAIDEQWKRIGPLGRAPWDNEVLRRPLTPRNAYTRANLPVLRGDANLADYVHSNGGQGGLPPVAVTAAGGINAGEIDVTITSSQAPTGWTLDAVVAQAVHDRDPAVLPVTFATEAEDVAPVVDGDTVITLTGLTSADLYAVGGWTRWTKPDGSTAYGASISAGLVAAT